ncbi:hypothetical protein [Ralstonia pseudosolanacearum]
MNALFSEDAKRYVRRGRNRQAKKGSSKNSVSLNWHIPYADADKDRC